MNLHIRKGMSILVVMSVSGMLFLNNAKADNAKCNYPGTEYNNTANLIDEEFHYVLKVYDPPVIMPNKFIKTIDDVNWTCPEDIINAVWIFLNRHKVWFLSLHTEIMKQEILEMDQLSEGKYLSNTKKGMPFEDPSSIGNYDKLLYKITYVDNGINKCIIYYTPYIDGEALTEGVGFTDLIFRNGRWLNEKFDVNTTSPIKKYFLGKTKERLLNDHMVSLQP